MQVTVVVFYLIRAKILYYVTFGIQGNKTLQTTKLLDLTSKGSVTDVNMRPILKRIKIELLPLQYLQQQGIVDSTAIRPAYSAVSH